jgi:hypothetical protein
METPVEIEVLPDARSGFGGRPQDRDQRECDNQELFHSGTMADSLFPVQDGTIKNFGFVERLEAG